MNWMTKSDFYKSGKLPKVCIHSLVEDKYSEFYEAVKKCECGGEEWVESEMEILKPSMGHVFPTKPVHRCKKCDTVRMATLKVEENENK